MPAGRDVLIENRTRNVAVTVLADGHAFAELRQGDSVSMRLAEQRSLLAMLPERSFFRRYRETFTS